MTGSSKILSCTDFNLDLAVFLAEASAAAYTELDATAFTRVHGFQESGLLDRGNVQGFWGVTPEAALLVFRGTSNVGQWIRDLRVLPAPYAWGWVHLGFLKGLEAVETDLLAFDQIAKASARVWVAGHSLGGALAVLTAARLKIRGVCSPLLFTYGQPAVGGADFASRFDQELPDHLWRLINQQDVVPRVPPLYSHCGKPKRITRPGGLGSVPGLEHVQVRNIRLPPAADHRRIETLREIIGDQAGTGLEVRGVRKLEDDAPAQLDSFELGCLQVALGAGEAPGLEGLTLESASPYLADHQLKHYIRLLTEIRDTHRI